MNLAGKKILAGAVLTACGVVLNLVTLIPHYATLSYDRSVLSGVHGGNGIYNLPALYNVPPVNYYLVTLGTVIIVFGVALLISGIVAYRNLHRNAHAN